MLEADLSFLYQRVIGPSDNDKAILYQGPESPLPWDNLGLTAHNQICITAGDGDTVVDDNYLGRRIDSAVLLPLLTRCLT